MHSLCTFRISYPYVRNEDFVFFFFKSQIQRLTTYDSVLDNFSYAGIRCRYTLWSERAFTIHCTENHVVLYYIMYTYKPINDR